MGTTDRAVESIAADQHGAISQRQMRETGLSVRQINLRVESGELLKFSFRSFALAGSADTFERRATCVLLHSPHAALSFDTVAAMYKVPGFQREPIHISEPRGFEQKPISIEVVRHQPTFLPAAHLVRMNGFAATSPTRLCADIAHLPRDRMSDKRKAKAIESIWASELTNRAALERMEAQWCERGRRGSRFLHEFLAERPTEFRPAETSLERRFAELIVDAGLPRPIPQANPFGEQGWFGRVDFRDPDLPLIAEIDSDRFHLAPLDQSEDKRRDEAATAAGFRTERFPEFQVWHEPRVVVERWRQARAEVRRHNPRAS